MQACPSRAPILHSRRAAMSVSLSRLAGSSVLAPRRRAGRSPSPLLLVRNLRSSILRVRAMHGHSETSGATSTSRLPRRRRRRPWLQLRSVAVQARLPLAVRLQQPLPVACRPRILILPARVPRRLLPMVSSSRQAASCCRAAAARVREAVAAARAAASSWPPTPPQPPAPTCRSTSTAHRAAHRASPLECLRFRLIPPTWWLRRGAVVAQAAAVRQVPAALEALHVSVPTRQPAPLHCLVRPEAPEGS
ncbi:MAG: hypothetical protein Athens041674_794 [Parcubacteria group bacterium Athens0416_74]|nr:MAG: hypothetical protein Athens041674_794 [Parcubacteria group bacterium Athens0416_74]